MAFQIFVLKKLKYNLIFKNNMTPWITFLIILIVIGAILRYAGTWYYAAKILKYLEENHTSFWQEHGSPKLFSFRPSKIYFYMSLYSKKLPQDENLLRLVRMYRICSWFLILLIILIYVTAYVIKIVLF